MAMTVERKIQKAKIALMGSKEFGMWGGVIMVGKTIVDDVTPTACTNGRDEWYGRGFMKSLGDKETAYIVMHENHHKGLRHLSTWQNLWKKDQLLANQACDYVSNLMIKKADPKENICRMPTDNAGNPIGLFDWAYDNMHSKNVFDTLYKEQQKNGGKQNGSQQGSGKVLDDHDWEGASKLSAEQEKELSREIETAIRQGAMAHEKKWGKGSGSTSLELSEILNPKLDWKQLLLSFVTENCDGGDDSSWQKPNRRFLGQDIYMPSNISERVNSVVVGIDTSGSIDPTQLQRLISEAMGMAKLANPNRIDLMYWDSEVEGHEVHENGYIDVQSTEPVGGGGTDPTCVQAYVKDKRMTPDCIVMLTDGYLGDWGTEWDAPILWVIVDNPTCHAPVGVTIHLET
jgi:predicted metal-dependent peptidase|tara:strand:+ start:2387 stop:3589 length:1203 start_codon:yes stop_codon:yes gene_type:complete